jgi:hypothetical protein
MQQSTEHHIRPSSAVRALRLLRSAVASYALVDTTDDPAVIVLQPALLAGPYANVTRLRLRTRHTGDTHVQDDAENVIVVGQRMSVVREDILAGRALTVVGCIDLAGIVTLRLPGVFIDRADLRESSMREPSAATVASETDPFADRSSLVCRALLEEETPVDGWYVRELARKTGLAVSRVSAVLTELVARDICRRTSHGRRKQLTTNRRALFEAWTSSYLWTDNTSLTVAAPVGDVERFAGKLMRLFPTDVRWALTLTAGVSRVAPHASVEKLHCYVNRFPDETRSATTPLGMLRAIAHECQWPETADGGLVLLAPHYRTSLWNDMRVVDGAYVVSDLQLALDCWHYPVRGREQAEHLLQSHDMFNDSWL